ncbi:hypothetical protein EV363DRAFT_672743 [Boletus edulis]|nr:hypothetical protein EV363DRAFT_672743 [Boletus edulis]
MGLAGTVSTHHPIRYPRLFSYPTAVYASHPPCSTVFVQSGLALPIFFAFSSKRRSSQVPLAQLQTDLLVPPQAVSGKWVPGSGQTQVHLVNAASIPSPLRADEEEYYYSYYPPSHPATPNPGSVDRSPSKQLTWRQQDLIGHPGIDSQLSSPVDAHPAHTQIRHPYAYSTPLYSKPRLSMHPRLYAMLPLSRLQHHPQDSRSGVRVGLAYASSHHGHDASKSPFALFTTRDQDIHVYPEFGHGNILRPS